MSLGTDASNAAPSSAMSLIVMGTGPFAVPAFSALHAAGHPIKLVVTKPQPPVKSRKGAPENPVRSWAESNHLPVFDPSTINDPEAIDRVAKLAADLLVVCDYGHILKPAALATGRLGGINLHGSLLPKYRGAAPVQWALLNGDAVTGVSVIHMTPKLDGGPILATRQTEIIKSETAGELEARLAKLGVDATLDAVELLAHWDGVSEIGVLQDKTQVTQAPRLNKRDGRIDWSRPASEIDFHVRGMQPWPIAFTEITVRPGKPPVRLAIKQVAIADPSADTHEPGTLVDTKQFLVATGDGVVEILRVQPAGKNEMDAADFLRGYQLAVGHPIG